MTDRSDKHVKLGPLTPAPAVLPDKITDTAEGRRMFASLTDEQRAMYRPSVADERIGQGDARTVLPGQPVGYHGSVSWRTPLGICIGTPVEVQTDPSKIVGAFTNEPRGEPEYPPVPGPGFYWAKLRGMGRWEPVEVIEHSNGVRRVEFDGEVTEWGPKLEPPGAPSPALAEIMALVDAYAGACEATAISYAELGPEAQAETDRDQATARAAVEAAIRNLLEPPGAVDDMADRLECAESELCRLTHHKRGDGCSIPGCRNYRSTQP